MPSIPRPKYRPYYLEVENEIWDGIEARCRLTRRSVKAEMNLALEHWLTLPPGFLPMPASEPSSGSASKGEAKPKGEAAVAPSKKGGKGK
jgi:hypothetical protein